MRKTIVWMRGRKYKPEEFCGLADLGTVIVLCDKEEVATLLSGGSKSYAVKCDLVSGDPSAMVPNFTICGILFCFTFDKFRMPQLPVLDPSKSLYLASSVDAVVGTPATGVGLSIRNLRHYSS
jgi:hypothetical protein